MYIYVWTSTHMCCTHGALSFFRANFSMDCFWGHALWFTIVYLLLIYLFIHFLIMFPLQFAGYIRVDIYAIIVFLNHFSFSTSSHWAVRFFSTFFSRPGVNRWNKKYTTTAAFAFCVYLFFFLQEVVDFLIQFHSNGFSVGLGLIGGSMFDAAQLGYMYTFMRVPKLVLFSFQSRSTELRKVETKPKQKSPKREFVIIIFPLCRKRKKGEKKEKGTTLTSQTKYLDLPG